MWVGEIAVADLHGSKLDKNGPLNHSEEGLDLQQQELPCSLVEVLAVCLATSDAAGHQPRAGTEKEHTYGA